MRATLSICLIVVLLIAGIAAYRLHRYTVAWDVVELAASRLDSSIQYEPVITMRGKMTDLDVALNRYKSLEPSKLVSNLVQRGKQIDQYEDVLSDLSQGLDRDVANLPALALSQDQWDVLGVRHFSKEELSLSCDKGKFVVYSSAIPIAYQRRGIRKLAALTGSREIKATPLDESGESAKCVAEEQTRLEKVVEVKAQNEQLKAQDERDRQVREKEAKRARSFAMCDHFKETTKNASATLSQADIATFLTKCEEVHNGVRNDLWQESH